MERKISAFYNFFKGGFLIKGDSAVKNWGLIIFVVVLLLVVVWSGHSADAKVLRISILNKEKQHIRSRYIGAKTSLARMRLESSVRKRVSKYGLSIGVEPPQKIKVIVNK